MSIISVLGVFYALYHLIFEYICQDSSLILQFTKAQWLVACLQAQNYGGAGQDSQNRLLFCSPWVWAGCSKPSRGSGSGCSQTSRCLSCTRKAVYFVWCTPAVQRLCLSLLGLCSLSTLWLSSRAPPAHLTVLLGFSNYNSLASKYP